MTWNVDNFLDLIDVRSLAWHFIDLAPGSGIRVGHSDRIYLHGVLSGSMRLTGHSGAPIEMSAGDVAIQITGNTHKLRCGEPQGSRLVELFTTASRNDRATAMRIGQGQPAARLLSARLKVLWPSGVQPLRLPSTLLTRAPDLGLDLDKLAAAGAGEGGVGVLNRAAPLLLVEALRSDPYFKAQLRWALRNPVARAQILIERYPFDAWSVSSLADRVGMGRSNFAARFLAETGTTPIRALRQERIKHAVRFLCTTDINVEDVGERVGYRSEGAFVRQFTRHFGVTPSKLRKQGRAGSDDPGNDPL